MKGRADAVSASQGALQHEEALNRQKLLNLSSELEKVKQSKQMLQKAMLDQLSHARRELRQEQVGLSPPPLSPDGLTFETSTLFSFAPLLWVCEWTASDFSASSRRRERSPQEPVHRGRHQPSTGSRGAVNNGSYRLLGFRAGARSGSGPGYVRRGPCVSRSIHRSLPRLHRLFHPAPAPFRGPGVAGTGHGRSSYEHAGDAGCSIRGHVD